MAPTIIATPVTDRRAFVIQSLRDMADFLEATPGAPLPCLFGQFDAFVSSEEQLSAAARVIGSFEKRATDDYFSLRKKVGAATYIVSASRKSVCKLVKVTKTIEKQVPVKFETVVTTSEERVPVEFETVTEEIEVDEYVCPESLLAEKEAVPA